MLLNVLTYLPFCEFLWEKKKKKRMLLFHQIHLIVYVHLLCWLQIFLCPLPHPPNALTHVKEVIS